MSDARLPHSIDMLSAFSRLKVEVPLTRTHIPAALDMLHNRRAHFLERRTQVRILPSPYHGCCASFTSLCRKVQDLAVGHLMTSTMGSELCYTNCLQLSKPA